MESASPVLLCVSWRILVFESACYSPHSRSTAWSAPNMAAEDKKGEAKEIEHVNPVPEEMSLPSAAIQRIIKSKLPEGVMIGKEAKIAFSKASSIFILYVTTMCAFSPPPPAPCVVCLVFSPPHSPPHSRSSATRSANDLAKEARRTTVTAQDVLHALRDLEFDEFLPAVEACLHGASSPPLPLPIFLLP